MASAEPDVVPARVLNVLNLPEVLLVGLGFEQLATLIVGVPRTLPPSYTAFQVVNNPKSILAPPLKHGHVKHGRAATYCPR